LQWMGKVEKAEAELLSIMENRPARKGDRSPIRKKKEERKRGRPAKRRT
jgi:hypothetical protein